MHSLSAELQRLFGRPGQDLPDALPEAGFALDLVSADERVWTMVIGLAPAAGWAPVAALCEGVVNVLDLPPPAVSVAGSAGFRVWFSLADPVPLSRAEAFLAGLRARFLAGVQPAHLSLLPSAAARDVPLAPGPGESGDRAVDGLHRSGHGGHVRRRDLARHGAQPGASGRTAGGLQVHRGGRFSACPECA
jgi:hypothetical protein